MVYLQGQKGAYATWGKVILSFLLIGTLVQGQNYVDFFEHGDFSGLGVRYFIGGSECIKTCSFGRIISAIQTYDSCIVKYRDDKCSDYERGYYTEENRRASIFRTPLNDRVRSFRRCQAESNLRERSPDL